jgi:NAD(P)-dependent dehydrogenase (short-subunit alcohol dehydrogenase family)
MIPDPPTGMNAIVTGSASGIGLAIAEARAVTTTDAELVLPRSIPEMVIQ